MTHPCFLDLISAASSVVLSVVLGLTENIPAGGWSLAEAHRQASLLGQAGHLFVGRYIPIS